MLVIWNCLFGVEVECCGKKEGRDGAREVPHHSPWEDRHSAERTVVMSPGLLGSLEVRMALFEQTYLQPA